MLGAKSPIRLAQLAIAASFGPVLCFLADVIPFTHRFLASHFSVYVIAPTVFVVSVGGIVLDLIFEQDLRNGIAVARWSDQEVATARAWMHQPIFRFGIWAFLLVYLGVLFWHLISHPHMGNLAMTIWPSLAISRLTMALKPTPPTVLREPRRPAAPLFSNQWGQSA